MFFRRIRGNDRQPLGSATNRRRPAAYRPGLESLEGRWLPSSTTPLAAVAAAPTATTTARTAGSSTTYSDTLLASGTGAGTAGHNSFFYDLRGTVAGGLPGNFTTKVFYTGALGSGTNAVTGGDVSLTVSGTHGSPGTVQGHIAGGTFRWNAAGSAAAVSVTVTVTGGTGAYSRDTGTATFTGTLDGTTQALSGHLTVNLKQPGSSSTGSSSGSTSHSGSSSSGSTSHSGSSSGSTTSTTYTSRLLATGTGAGTAGHNTFFYDLEGTLAGKLAGIFTTRVLYAGALGHGTNAVTGGTWSLNVLTRGLTGKLQGRLAGGSIRWNAGGTAATVAVTLTVTGGTGPYAGDTGTATFTGTLDGDTQALSGSVTLNLKHRGSSSGSSSGSSGSSSSTTFSDRLLATGTGAGTSGRNFYYDLQGTLAGKLPGFFTTRVLYAGALGHGTNPITGGSVSLTVSGTHGSPGKVRGQITGGSIRWNAAGSAATVSATVTVTGGTGAYSRDTGTATFTGTLDGVTQALSGHLNLTLKPPRR